jgi:hypothetical protein
MTDTTRTVLYVQTDDGTEYPFDFKGALSVPEAVTRAKAITRANPRLDHTVRGHLLSCLDNDIFEVVTPATAA